MRVLLAGGAGFVGSHLADRLLGRGDRVVIIDDLCTGEEANVPDGALFVWCDVTMPLPDLGTFDVVVNLASPAAPDDYRRMPVGTLEAGSTGTLNLLRLATRQGARFVLTSTSEVYGDPEVHPQPESYVGHVDPVGPRSMYDEAKRFAESATMAFVRTFDLDGGIARLFNAYGPRMRDDGRVVPTFLRQALKGEPLTVFGDGTQTRSMTWVGDTVEMLVRLIDRRGLVGPINVGSEFEMTMLELAELVVELTGSSSRVVHEVLPPDDPKRRRPDLTKARGLLGFVPTVEPRDGLAETVAWFRGRLSVNA